MLYEVLVKRLVLEYQTVLVGSVSTEKDAREAALRTADRGQWERLESTIKVDSVKSRGGQSQ